MRTVHPPFDPAVAAALVAVNEILPSAVTPDLIGRLRDVTEAGNTMSLDEIRGHVHAEERMVPGPAREPDLLFVAQEHLDRLSEARLSGPADLVIEVVSDDSVARDRADKFYEYQAAGIPEYWIIDSRPGRSRVDFYVLDHQGRYQPVPADSDGRYHATVLPGLWLQVEWLMAEEPPAVLQALARVVGPHKLLEAIDDTPHS